MREDELILPSERRHTCLLYELICGNEYGIMRLKIESMELGNTSISTVETGCNPYDKVGVDFMTNQPKYKMRIYRIPEESIFNRFYVPPPTGSINPLFILELPKLTPKKLAERLRKIADDTKPIEYVPCNFFIKSEYIHHNERERRR